MKRKRFSVKQMVAVLKQAEVGMAVVEVCRRVGITEQTFYRWKKKYVGLEDRPGPAAEAASERKREAEEAGGRAEFGQGHATGCARKKILKLSCRRPVVHYLCGAYRVSQRHACRTAQVAESTLRYRSRREPRTALRLRIREIAQVRIGYGYRKIRVLLKREGLQVGKKLVYRCTGKRA